MIRKNPNITKLFKGFRVGKKPSPKLNLKFLEKHNKLTDLQNQIVKDFREKCTLLNSSKKHRDRLDKLLEKPVILAATDYLGNKVERKEEEKDTKDKEIPKPRKGKSTQKGG